MVPAPLPTTSACYTHTCARVCTPTVTSLVTPLVSLHRLVYTVCGTPYVYVQCCYHTHTHTRTHTHTHTHTHTQAHLHACGCACRYACGDVYIRRISNTDTTEVYYVYMYTMYTKQIYFR